MRDRLDDGAPLAGGVHGLRRVRRGDGEDAEEGAVGEAREARRRGRRVGRRRSPSPRRGVDEGEDDWVPPSIISFHPESEDDDLSLLSW